MSLAPIPWHPCDGHLVKGYIVQHPLPNEAKITLGGRVAFGCPVQTMSLEWLSLSRNCPGGGWGFNEQRKQSYTIIPGEFPPECVLGCLNWAIHLLVLREGSHPNFLARAPGPLASCLWSMEPVCHGSQTRTNRAHHISTLSENFPKVSLSSFPSVPLTRQPRPPNNQPNTSSRKILGCFPCRKCNYGTRVLKTCWGPHSWGWGHSLPGKGQYVPWMVASVHKNSVRPSGPCRENLQEDRWRKETTVCTLRVAMVIRKSTGLKTFVFFFLGSYWFSRLTSTNPGCGQWSEKASQGPHRGFPVLNRKRIVSLAL